MTQRERITRPSKVVLTGLFIAAATLGTAGVAAADPGEPYPVPGPSEPVPGQPFVVPVESPVGPPPAPPVGPPTVPEIANPVYGQGQTPGQFGYLRDLWHAARSGNPVGALTAPPTDAPGPPPGAGPAPALPPGYVSLTAPESSTPGKGYGPGPDGAGPALPPGYFPLTGPPPPGWYDSPPGIDPAAATTPVPVPPIP